ncbi:Hypothetical predicted protein [Xyrichtys novacula]|uniref:Uncharacterized protein n=1 Tax=Xyrichtys novacula TaxID=13765 RepID=A0AAV1EMY3_XYRNO|nr:Hypothetical predicted protein [Xyrichtys novacula]
MSRVQQLRDRLERLRCGLERLRCGLERLRSGLAEVAQLKAVRAPLSERRSAHFPGTRQQDRVFSQIQTPVLFDMKSTDTGSLCWYYMDRFPVGSSAWS